MILLIDNYDSFSFNVYQLAASVEPDVRVVRNDELTAEEIAALAPTHIILSPGPGRPADAGVCEEVIRRFAGKIPILGICLGHQAICEVFGAQITYAKQLMHGKQSLAVLDTDSVLFRGMNKEITVARYHSLAAELPTDLEALRVTARTYDGEIMAVEHEEYPVYGVQFHPESVLTPEGYQIMENFLGKKSARSERICEDPAARDAGEQKNPGKPDTAGEQKNLEKPDAGREQKNPERSHAAGEQSNPERPEGKQAPEKEAEDKSKIEEVIIRLSKKQDIGYETARDVMNEIMNGQASDVQKSAYLTALSMKGETIEEITGSAEAMRSHALQVDHGMEVLEIVGTGGDGSNSFNISTTAALIAAGAGVPVAKHGNRAASSKSGAADCLEALGVNISVEPEKAAQMLHKAGICFLFAQKYHTAMRHVAPIRRELGIRTIFNILGPLANPARAGLQVMGVYDESLLEPMARVLLGLGVRKGMVVYGREKLDEISICGPTDICCFKEGKLQRSSITPESVGLKRGEKGDLLGGTPAENAAITRAILEGRERGAKRDAAVINAAAALFIAGKAESMGEAVKLAEETIDSGRALEKLEQFIALSNAPCA